MAFEFHGQQHYGATGSSTPPEVDKQRAHDIIKAGICEDRGIRLVVVHPEDLTVGTMIRRVGTCLPLRDLRNSGLIVRYLERMSSHYRQAALGHQGPAAEEVADTEADAKHLLPEEQQVPEAKVPADIRCYGPG